MQLIHTPEFHERTDEELVKLYETAAMEHAQATRQCDSNAANHNADTIAMVYRELRRRGGESRQLLVPLLSSSEPGVRVWAGAHALEFAPEIAEPVLEQLVPSMGAIGLDAKMTLMLWKQGQLKFP